METDPRGAEIFVVDDDPTVREALSVIFTLEGYQVTGFGEGASLLAAARSRVPVCILLDLDIPGRSGLDILREFKNRNYPAPIVIISARGQVPMVVEAMKYGALDFIEKPLEVDTVATRVRDAIDSTASRAVTSDLMLRRFPGRDLLTRREREVVAQIVAGATSKAAGRHLGISWRTVDVHRARIMQKLGARNAPDLIRIVLSESQRQRI